LRRCICSVSGTYHCLSIWYESFSNSYLHPRNKLMLTVHLFAANAWPGETSQGAAALNHRTAVG
jgi:hypothetical protein